MTGFSVNLDKLSEGFSVNLEKRLVDATSFPRDINVTLALDVSGSMSSAFSDGSVLHTMQRILAVSNTIDDDGILNFFCFSETSMEQKDLIAKADFKKLPDILRAISRKGSPYWSGTNFAPVLHDVVAGHTTGTVTQTVTRLVNANTTFFGRILNLLRSLVGLPALMKSVQETSTSSSSSTDTKQLVLLITDGCNWDTSETRRFFESMKSQKNFYFQCIGVGASNSDLKDHARNFSNVGYTELTSFTEGDDALADALVSNDVLRHFGY